MNLTTKPQVLIEFTGSSPERDGGGDLGGELVENMIPGLRIKAFHPKVISSNGSDSTFSVHKALPRRLDSATKRGDHAQT